MPVLLIFIKRKTVQCVKQKLYHAFDDKTAKSQPI